MNNRPTDCREASQADADHKLEISFSSDGNILVVALAGSIVSKTAGALLDTLADLVVNGNRKLILDVSEVKTTSRAGLRGIVVTARLLQVGGGQMRICGAAGDTLAALHNLSLPHLIHIDRSRAEARCRLSQRVSSEWRPPGNHSPQRPYDSAVSPGNHPDRDQRSALLACPKGEARHVRTRKLYAVPSGPNASAPSAEGRGAVPAQATSTHRSRQGARVPSQGCRTDAHGF